MLIERQKKKLTAIRRMRKIANRPAKHRALQHSAHASLRAFFPLELFVDRSVYPILQRFTMSRHLLGFSKVRTFWKAKVIILKRL